MLTIYRSDDTSSPISTDSTSPLLSSHNRKRFHPDIHKLYVRNDNTAAWISNLSVYATSTVVDIYSNAGNFGVKFYAGDLEPTDRVWNAVNYNEPIKLDNLGTVSAGDTSTFLPFWLRVEAGANAPVALQKGFVVATWIEHAV